MRIHLARTGVTGAGLAVDELEELAAKSRSGRHQLTDDPEDAEACLFGECHLFGDPITLRPIWQSDTFRAHRSKSFVFDQRPRSYCSMPGLYTSVPRRYLHSQFQIPWSYHRIETPQDVLGDSWGPGDQPDLLFSYVGSGRSHPSRPPLLELRHPRGLVQQVEGHVNWSTDDAGFGDRRRLFAESVLRSKFVLCPRGRATSSFRFYEVLAAGRVPVVIADDWVAPAGMNLDEVAIVWPEGSTRGLLDYLEKREPDAAELGARAREIYDQRFAQDVMFDNIGDALERLVATDPWERFPRWGFAPDRRVVRHVAGKLRKQLRPSGR